MVYVFLFLVGSLSAFVSGLLSLADPRGPRWHDGDQGVALLPDLIVVPAFWCAVGWSLETYGTDGGAVATLVFLMAWNGAKLALLRRRRARRIAASQRESPARDESSAGSRFTKKEPPA
ncbi:hypothetical protein Pla163_00430 [Planctomycetes bacterium Pla163]|uniref:Uncharacterized protein n=1 Tax=Rohdeia mirabilis TaxID=2528008 RepID=A0A518CUQ9_9BACT|nr:hypothetical protein Pla163_00430 [Planctomycetes bacterium Pla163]